MNHEKTEKTINEIAEIYSQINYLKNLISYRENRLMHNECDDLPTYSEPQIIQFMQNIEVYNERIAELENEIVELIKGIEL